jgi:hypothetical protein
MMGKGLPVVIVKLRSQASPASHIIVGWIEHRTGVVTGWQRPPRSRVSDGRIEAIGTEMMKSQVRLPRGEGAQTSR